MRCRLAPLSIRLGLGLIVAFTGLWVSSLRYQCGIELNNRASFYFLVSNDGALRLEYLHNSRGGRHAWILGANAGEYVPSGTAWLPSIDSGPKVPGTARASWLIIHIPYWLPILLLAGPTTYLIHRQRRNARLARTDLCPHCSYSLAGLAPDAPCPECGGAQRA